MHAFVCVLSECHNGESLESNVPVLVRIAFGNAFAKFVAELELAVRKRDVRIWGERVYDVLFRFDELCSFRV